MKYRALPVNAKPSLPVIWHCARWGEVALRMQWLVALDRVGEAANFDVLPSGRAAPWPGFGQRLAGDGQAVTGAGASAAIFISAEYASDQLGIRY